MKKFILIGFLILTIFALQGEERRYDLSKPIERIYAQKAEKARQALKEQKIRAIDQYLSNTPLKGKGAKILAISNRYSVSASLLLGIAKAESSLGRHYVKNNIMGIGGADNMWGFASMEDSIEQAAKLIREHQAYSDFRRTGDIRHLAKRYCPPTWESWASNVTKYQAEVEESIN
jgi:uncharacterized FlgJ-related protein